MPDQDAPTTVVPAPESPTLCCDTCGRPTRIVSRVVIDEGYNRANARPLWNCPDCYAEKERRRRA